jgi:hypothetical protein
MTTLDVPSDPVQVISLASAQRVTAARCVDETGTGANIRCLRDHPTYSSCKI